MSEKVFNLSKVGWASWYLDLPIHFEQSVLLSSPGQPVWPADSCWTHGACLKHRAGTSWCHPQHWAALSYGGWKGWGAFPLAGSVCPVTMGAQGMWELLTAPCAARRGVRGYPAHVSWLQMSHLLLMTSPDYCCALALNFQPRGERLLHSLGN